MRKTLYTFKINKKELVEKKTQSKDDKGQEVISITKVEEEVPYSFQILKPLRKEVDEAELYYGINLSLGVQKGLMPKALLMKKYADNDGIFSEKEKQKYKELYDEYLKLVDTQTKIKEEVSEELKVEQEKRKTEIYNELMSYQKAQLSLFEYTAENWAKNKTIIWWALNLSAKEDGSNFFEGKTVEDKIKSWEDIEANEDIFRTEVVSKFILLITLWYNGHANTEKDFDNILKISNQQLE